MLAKDYRLSLTSRNPLLFTYRSPYFVAKVSRIESDTPRFGFIISKKTARHAVTRNRVKRQLRAGIEGILPRIKPGYGILFIIQKGAIGVSTTSFTQNITDFLKQKDLL